MSYAPASPRALESVEAADGPERVGAYDETMCALEKAVPAQPETTSWYTARSAFNVSILSLALTLIAVAAGLATTIFTKSSSTLGYALENFVDTVGSLLVLWRFEGGGATLSTETLERREKRASIGIAVMFCGLGLCVASTAAAHLVHRESLEEMTALLGLAVPSFAIFSSLGAVKWRIASAIDSPALKKDAICSLAGGVLSLGVLLSYVLHQHADIWWADAAIAVVIGALLSLYGADTLRRNTHLRWWTALFWSEGQSRKDTKAKARAAMADLHTPDSGDML